MTIWRMRIACWIAKATHTHSQYLIRIAFPLQQWLQERASILHLYVHCLVHPALVIYIEEAKIRILQVCSIRRGLRTSGINSVGSFNTDITEYCYHSLSQFPQANVRISLLLHPYRRLPSLL